MLQGEISRAFNITAQSPLGKAPLAEIIGRDAKLLHRKLKEEFGVPKAQRIMKWLRYALNVAVQQKLIAGTPMHKMRIEARRRVRSGGRSRRSQNRRRWRTRWGGPRSPWRSGSRTTSDNAKAISLV